MSGTLYIKIMLSPESSREHSPSADEAVARVRLWFSDRPLRELEAEGILKWDSDENVVKRGGRFDTKLGEIPR